MSSCSRLPAAAAIRCLRPTVVVLDFDPLGFSSRGRRETGAVVAAYPPTPKGLWSGFCASTTNHKLRLMINSCSFSGSGSTRQLASACDLATVSISNKTDKKRTPAHTFARLSHYLTFMRTLDTHSSIKVLYCIDSYDRDIRPSLTVPESRIA